MKKNSLSLCAIFFFAFGISSYGQWQLTGNANATSTSVLGTTNAIPLSLVTKNTKRLVIDTLGRVGVGTSTPVNIFTVKGAGSTPAPSWANAGAPLFVGFGETAIGNADFILGMGAAAANARPVFIGRKSRGTLAVPATVSNNDFLMSFLASGYDGTSFQNPVAIDFYVDGTPSSGNVPGRISFVTGTNSATRAERLKIGSTGDIIINGTQLTVTKSTGDVGIGAGNLLVAKKANIKGIVGVNGDTLASTALNVNADSAHNGINVTDAKSNFVLYADKSGTNAGIYVSKSSTTTGTGSIVGVATGSGTGVEGYGSTNVGVYAQSDSSMGLYTYSASNYGLYSETGDTSSFAGVFIGDVYSSGTYFGSDARLKNNIKDFGNAMQLIGTLQPKNYDYKKDGLYASLNLPRGNHYGLIAQDLEKVLPNLVKQTKVYIKDHKKGDLKKDNGFNKGQLIDFKAVNYTELIPIMIKGMQELSKKNDELGMINDELKTKAANQQQVNEDLQLQINELKKLIKGNSITATEKNSQSVVLNSGEASLAQNVPNPPVNNATRIGYNVPNGSTKAELIITDVYGKKMKQITLSNTGKGVLNVDTNGMVAGTYTYTLMVDGKMKETKKMVVAGK